MSEDASERTAKVATGIEKSKKIVDFIRKELMLPGNITKLRVDFCIGDALRVDCSFIPGTRPQVSGIRHYVRGEGGQAIDVTCL